MFATEMRFSSTDNIERDSTIVKFQANRGEKMRVFSGFLIIAPEQGAPDGWADGMLQAA